METQFISKDKNKIRKSIRKKYKKAARSTDGLFKYHTGRAGLEGLHYVKEFILKLPESVAASFCGLAMWIMSEQPEGMGFGTSNLPAPQATAMKELLERGRPVAGGRAAPCLSQKSILYREYLFQEYLESE